MQIRDRERVYDVDPQIINGRTLKNEQMEGIEFILTRENCILNHQPGTGKTFCTILAFYYMMKEERNSITIIMCPKQANTAFKKEFQLMGLQYSIVSAEETKMNNKGRFFIFNYSSAEKALSFVANCKEKGFVIHAIFDEIHMLMNPESNMTQICRKMRPMLNRVVGATGTPLLNHIEGLYNVCHYVQPWYLGRFTDFAANYIKYQSKRIWVGYRKQKTVQEIVGYKDLEGLRAKLEPLIQSRGRDYPINFEFRECNFTEDEKDYYEKAAKDILNEGAEGDRQFSARIWDLQRVVDGSHSQLDGDHLWSKKKLLLKVVKEIVDRGEGVLIYTEIEDTYTDLKDLIEKAHQQIGYSKLYMVTGKVSFDKRVQVEKNLKARDIVIVTRAGNKSINLQAVNNVIFYNLPFACGDYLQMVGRIARTDSEYQQMNVYHLEVEGTIDTYKRLLIKSNMSLIQEIFGKTSTMPYYGDVDSDNMKKYKKYFKDKLLWVK